MSVFSSTKFKNLFLPSAFQNTSRPKNTKCYFVPTNLLKIWTTSRVQKLQKIAKKFVQSSCVLFPIKKTNQFTCNCLIKFQLIARSLNVQHLLKTNKEKKQENNLKMLLKITKIMHINNMFVKILINS